MQEEMGKNPSIQHNTEFFYYLFAAVGLADTQPQDAPKCFWNQTEWISEFSVCVTDICLKNGKHCTLTSISEISIYPLRAYF